MEDNYKPCPWCGEPLSISKNNKILYECRNFECSYVEYMYLNPPKIKAKGGKKLMTPTDIWNELVNLYVKVKAASEKSEKIIQQIWENLFEAFGYSKFWDEIDSHRSIQIGSTERVIPDIIIRQKQETSWQDCFLVELKCYTPKEDKHKQQLFSYLKQLKLDMGILVCDKIYLYDYNINKDDNNQSVFVIDFTKDNPDGIKFVELFSKNSFNKQNIKAFIKNRNQEESDIKAIQQKVTTDFIHEILKEHLGSTYSPETIQKALEKIVITVGQKALKQQVTIPLAPKAVPIGKAAPSLDKGEILKICHEHGINLPKEFTKAAKNAGAPTYWANPNKRFLYQDWWLVLDDLPERKLHVFMIPANSIQAEKFNFKNADLIDLQIHYNDHHYPNFTDRASKIDFKQWLVQTIPY